MNDLITLEDIATMHRCSIRHARDMIVRLPGFHAESSGTINSLAPVWLSGTAAAL